MGPPSLPTKGRRRTSARGRGLPLALPGGGPQSSDPGAGEVAEHPSGHNAKQRHYLASPTGGGGLGLGTNLTSVIFLSTILALVVFLAISKRDVIRSGVARDLAGEGNPAVLVVLNKVEATAARLDAVKRRTAAGAARFFVLVPNPDHVGFDRNGSDSADGEALLARA